MKSVTKLKKDVETLRRALTPKKEYEDHSACIGAYMEAIEAFHQLPCEEQQRIIKEMEATPATEFTGGDPDLAVYAEALKKSAIRNLQCWWIYDKPSNHSERN